MRQLAAQVQAVLGAVEAALLRLLHGVDHLFQIFQTIAAVAHVADRHRVQHRGDAAGDHQRVVAAHCRMGGPVHLRARGEEFIQIIGMQLNQPRQQPAAVAVHRLRERLWVSAKARMMPSRISTEPFTTSFSSTSLTLLIIMRLSPSGAACPLRDCGRRRRGRSRRSPPARFGLFDQCYHRCAVLASSEAVGSSSSKIG